MYRLLCNCIQNCFLLFDLLASFVLNVKAPSKKYQPNISIYSILNTANKKSDIHLNGTLANAAMELSTYLQA